MRREPGLLRRPLHDVCCRRGVYSCESMSHGYGLVQHRNARVYRPRDESTGGYRVRD